MAEAKFRPTAESVERLIEAVPDEQVRDDGYELVRIMRKCTGADPVLWAGGIIGFGKYHYVYDSGHQGDACLSGFAIRKNQITLYALSPDLPERDGLIKRLGKCKATKGCIHIKKLEDIDTKVLEEMIEKSVAYLRKRYSH